MIRFALNIYLALLFLLISCKSNYEKYMLEYNECVQDKMEKKNLQYANIQEALNAFNFQVARDYLACHPNRNEVVDKVGLTGKRYYRPYQSDLELIVRSEITYFVSQGEFRKAEESAKEANMIDDYVKISEEGFENKLDEMINKKEFKKIYSYLCNKRSSYQKNKYDIKEESGDYWSGNKQFNESARAFNALLDNVLIKYKYEKVNNDEMRALVDMSLRELIDCKNKKNSDVQSCLTDLYKKEAIIKYLK